MINERLFLPADARSLLPLRSPAGNKGTFGHALLLCGSRNMVGCCVLACEGALRSGAGMVTLGFPDILYLPLTSRLTENLFLPLPSTPAGTVSEAAIPALLSAAAKADVVLFGCGVGSGKAVFSVCEALLKESETPLILDADALNVLSASPELLLEAKAEVLLTPHPGEMARLCHTSVSAVESHRARTALSFSQKYGVTLLLKGKETLVCSRTGDAVSVNTTGNNGLSKGGSGDLLSGILAGLAPNMKNLYDTARLGAFLHGAVADIVEKDCTAYAMLPSDCANALPKAFRMLTD